jgi:acyl-CoA thioesterase I
MNRLQVLIFSFAWILSAASCGNSDKTVNDASKTGKVDTAAGKVKTILFFGNSLTAGYGVEPSQAFPALIQNKIDSLGLPYRVVNAGVSGETSSGGNSRIDWILKQPVDVFVLELGANDGLRGVPVAETKRNLQSIIDKVKAKYPDVELVLAGMQVPPNMGPQYTSEFQDIFPELAKKNDMELIPFLLEGVGGEAKLNLEDGIHPTAEGHKIVAENVWEVLEGEIRSGE